MTLLNVRTIVRPCLYINIVSSYFFESHCKSQASNWPEQNNPCVFSSLLHSIGDPLMEVSWSMTFKKYSFTDIAWLDTICLARCNNIILSITGAALFNSCPFWLKNKTGSLKKEGNEITFHSKNCTYFFLPCVIWGAKGCVTSKPILRCSQTADFWTAWVRGVGKIDRYPNLMNTYLGPENRGHKAEPGTKDTVSVNNNSIS